MEYPNTFHGDLNHTTLSQIKAGDAVKASLKCLSGIESPMFEATVINVDYEQESDTLYCEVLNEEGDCIWVSEQEIVEVNGYVVE